MYTCANLKSYYRDQDIFKPFPSHLAYLPCFSNTIFCNDASFNLIGHLLVISLTTRINSHPLALANPKVTTQ